MPATRRRPLGGGDAWAVSEEAPDEAVDFVKYLLSDEVQIGFAENDMGLPTNSAASGSVPDPALAGLLEVRDAGAVRPALLRHRLRRVGRRRA